MSYYPFILVGLVAIGLIVRALGASASRATAAAAAPIADQIGGPSLSKWRAAFAKSLASKGASISTVSDPIDALTATREGTFQRDVVFLVEHDVFDAHAEGLEDRLVKLARHGRPHSFRHNGQCAVCLVVGGPGAVDALPQARLRHGIGWYVVVTALDTTTNRASDMPSKVQAGNVLSVPILTGMQEAVTALALAGGDATEELKTCPDCAERVRVAARRCRFCGFQFAGPSKQVGSEPEAVDPTDEASGAAEADTGATTAVVQPLAQSLEQDLPERGRPPGVVTAPTGSDEPSTIKIATGMALVVVGAVTALGIWLAPSSRSPAPSAPTASAGAIEAAPAPEETTPAPKRRRPGGAARRSATRPLDEVPQPASTWTSVMRDQTRKGCVAQGNDEGTCACITRSLEAHVPYDNFVEWRTRAGGIGESFGATLTECRMEGQFSFSCGGNDRCTCDMGAVGVLPSADVIGLLISADSSPKLVRQLKRECSVQYVDPFGG